MASPVLFPEASRDPGGACSGVGHNPNRSVRSLGRHRGTGIHVPCFHGPSLTSRSGCASMTSSPEPFHQTTWNLARCSRLPWETEADFPNMVSVEEIQPETSPWDCGFGGQLISIYMPVPRVSGSGMPLDPSYLSTQEVQKAHLPPPPGFAVTLSLR